MSRKKTSSPRRRLRTLHVATLLPPDPQALYLRAFASWTGVKADKVHFANLPPNTLDVDLLALSNALEDGPSGGTVGTATIVGAAAQVRHGFKLLAPYVEGVLRALPIEEVPAILAEVLMFESNVGRRPPKPPLAVKHGPLPGVLLLAALAMARVTAYYWEVSLDGLTWTVGAETSQARASIAGLTPGKVYSVRVRGLQRSGGMTSYTQVVSLMCM